MQALRAQRAFSSAGSAPARPRTTPLRAQAAQRLGATQQPANYVQAHAPALDLQASGTQQERAPSAHLLATASALLGAALPTAAAWADEAAAVVDAAASPKFLGIFNPSEAVILISPLVIYSIFYLYRDKVNPKATVSDLLLIVAALIIVGNIFSIAVFKVRYF